MHPPRIDEAFLRRSTDSGSFERGRQYHRKRLTGNYQIHNQTDEDLHFTAETEGSRGKPYEQDVLVEFDEATGEPVRLDGLCSCPVEFNCKHVDIIIGVRCCRHTTLISVNPKHGRVKAELLNGP
ncbi:MAG: hypothetical protein R6U87_09035 [Thiohalospira sp.]